ncbi:hypothetical protein P1J78_01215 [Psychromarinibacter sp. C21-152]|uniref:Uncharacterized protein n=1 Tax=Psychromarinibacter sediminicola TaxID=3033385 RepID=A0AAE3NQZ8_9RHOB|nr:hypothetical protein [Psychromarinibacter sediminicola]MDF0599340.1 hypothetical protein [Psychromarinibacter sediminicola]
MQVCKLQPLEAVGLEYEQLERFWRRLGPETGELALGAAMEDIALMMHEAQMAWQLGDRPALRRCAAGLRGAADRLGMPLLCVVAGDVLTLCDDGDASALAATVARLQRVGERSLCAVWDAQVPVG